MEAHSPPHLPPAPSVPPRGSLGLRTPELALGSLTGHCRGVPGKEEPRLLLAPAPALWGVGRGRRVDDSPLARRDDWRYRRQSLRGEPAAKAEAKRGVRPKPLRTLRMDHTASSTAAELPGTLANDGLRDGENSV